MSVTQLFLSAVPSAYPNGGSFDDRAQFLDAVCVKLAQFPGFADLFVDNIKDASTESVQVFLPAAMLKPLLLTNRLGGMCTSDAMPFSHNLCYTLCFILRQGILLGHHLCGEPYWISFVFHRCNTCASVTLYIECKCNHLEHEFNIL